MQAITGQTYTVKDVPINNYGKSHTITNNLLIDHDGFLWYTCPEGIVKVMDNHQSLFENEKDACGRHSNHAGAILLDSQSRIWVITEYDIHVHDLISGEFKEVCWSFPSPKDEFTLTSILEDSQQNIWVGTLGHYVLKIDNLYNVKTIELPRSQIVKEGKDIKDSFLYLDRVVDDNKILMHRGSRVYVIHQDEIFEKINLRDTKNGQEENILITSNGALFPKNKSGSYVFKDKTFKYYYLDDLNVQILETPFREMKFIANPYAPGTLYSVDDLNKNIVFLELTSVDKVANLKVTSKIEFEYAIEDIVTDSLGIVYVSCLDEIKEIKFQNNQFHKLLNDHNKSGKTPNVSTRGFIELTNGNILLATYYGIFKLTPKNDSYLYTKVLPEIKYARSFEKINDSILLAVGDYDEIFQINTNKMSAQVYMKHTKGTYMYNLAKTSDSTLLISSHIGLLELNHKSKHLKPIPFLSEKHNISRKPVNDVRIINNSLYVSTREQGLFIKDLKTGKVVHYYKTDNDQGLSSNHIFSVFVDSDGTLWIGTDNGVNFIKKDEKEVLKLNVTDNISRAIAIGFLEDSKNNIWIITYNGLFQYHKKSKEFYFYFMEDGLPFNEFNQQSYFKSSNGTLFFGGLNGIIYLDSISPNYNEFQPPKIFPVEYTYFDTHLNKMITPNINDQKKNEFNLPYANNFWSIKVSMNRLMENEKNQYLYKIDGLSQTWVNMGNQNVISQYYLPPGNHTIRIKGINDKGLETSNELTYQLNVENIFYNELWFRISLALAMILLSILIIVYFVKKNREKAFLHLALIELERKAVTAQMNPHFIFNAVNNINAQLTTKKNFDFIEHYIVNLSNLMRLTLELTRNENISISKELNYINTYIELENSKQTDKVNFKIDCDPTIDKDRMLIPSMMLQPIIENSIKHAFKKGHSGEKTIELKISKNMEKEELIFIIEDNGIGLSNSSKAYHGHHASYAIQILSERIALLNKVKKHKKSMYEINIEDLKKHNKRGTKTLITIPM